MFKKSLIRIATLLATEQQNAGGLNDKLEKETALKKKNKKAGVNKLELKQDAIAKEDAFMDQINKGEESS